MALVFFDRKISQACILTLVLPSFHHSLSKPTSSQGYLTRLQPRWPELPQQPAVHLPTVLCQLCAHSPVCPHQCGGSCSHETSGWQQQGSPGGCRNGCWDWAGICAWTVLPQVRLLQIKAGKRSRNRKRWWENRAWRTYVHEMLLSCPGGYTFELTNQTATSGYGEKPGGLDDWGLSSSRQTLSLQGERLDFSSRLLSW